MTEPEPLKIPEESAPEGYRKDKSKGEKLFDWVTYGGFAGVGTFLVTIPVTYLLKHHEPVKPHFDKVVDFVAKGLRKLPFKTDRTTADKIVTTTALMQGGNLMLLPVGLLEKHKVPIVSGLNVAMGDKTPEEQIEHAPKQTWWSLIESRAVAWLAVFTAFTAAGKFVPKTLGMFENEVGERMTQLFNKPMTRQINGKMRESKTFIYGKIGALDFFATIAAATLLYVGGHFFARRHEEKKELRESQREGKADARDEAALDTAEASVANGPSAQVMGGKTVSGTVTAVMPPELAPN